MKKIVLVDDDIDLLALVTKFLNRNEAFNTKSFNTSKEALAYINDNTSDINLIITDISMPIMNGIELLDNCKNISNIPILILTAYQDKNIVTSAYKMENKVLTMNYIVKPFNVDILISSINSLLKTQDLFHNLTIKNRKIKSLMDTLDNSNQYLTEKLENILKDHQEDANKINRVKELMNNIINNDLPLIKFVLKIIESNEKILDSIIGEGEELFKIMPKTIEPLKTVISDIVVVGQILVDIGIISQADLKQIKVEKTTFYQILNELYLNGGFDSQTFSEFLKMMEFKVESKSIIF